jgi:putative DNA primase/helicase
MKVPLDYPAVVAVLCLAGVTARRARVQPKLQDKSWIVVPNLWGGIVAPPGLMKSPVINAITRPLREIEKLWRTQYASEVCDYQDQKERIEIQQSAWREMAKAAMKKGKDAPIRPDDSITEPICPRLVTQDATFERLHEIMRDNPAGVLLIYDELSGWLAALDKFGRESDRGFFLSAWNGDTAYTVDRIGRGSIHVDACCVSILGGIQPARLKNYLSDALQDGPNNDGLFQRFQVLVYPDVLQKWRYVDREPNQSAELTAQHVYDRLARMETDQPMYLRFAPDAQELFVAWLTDLEQQVRTFGTHMALVSHLANYRSLMPSLAALFELTDTDGNNGAISLEHAQQAAAFCEYLSSHSRRIYSMIVSPERQAAAALGCRIVGGWKRAEGLFTVRDVYRNEWQGLSTVEAVRQVLPILEDANWIRPVLPEPKAGGGRPTELYALNPRIWSKK